MHVSYERWPMNIANFHSAKPILWCKQFIIDIIVNYQIKNGKNIICVSEIFSERVMSIFKLDYFKYLWHLNNKNNNVQTQIIFLSLIVW